MANLKKMSTLWVVFIGLFSSHSYGANNQLDQALIKALINNHEEQVSLLLSQGANPNHINNDGKTALQISIAKDSFHNTAQLLRYNASLQEFKRLLPTINQNTLHLIRETYQRLPDPRYKRRTPSFQESEAYVAELEQHGFVKISGFLSSEQLAQLKTEFATFLDDIELLKNQIAVPMKKKHDIDWRKDEKIFISHSPFVYSPTLMAVCGHPLITDTINNYLGKIGYIHKGQISHFLPGGKRGGGVFNWHHDAAGKRVKLMILMSETDEDSRCMSLIPNSHKIIHNFDAYKKNIRDPKYCLSFIPSIESIKFTGQPGDMYIFDTNSFHTGNVAPKGRDVFLISYSSDFGHIRPCKIDESIFDQYPMIDQAPFSILRNIQNDQNFKYPPASNWVGNLNNVDTWLMDRDC